MNNIEQAQKAVEEAEKKLQEAKEDLARAKTQKIGLKIPLDGERYYCIEGRETNQGLRGNSDDLCYLQMFRSTNRAQAQAFAEALQVMAELRCQDGIVVPSEQCFTIRCNGVSVWLSEDFKYFNAQVISPAYSSQEYAQKAIDNVGKERIIAAYKTMMFMTPESRGKFDGT